ncbi:MAG: hypothetical protein ACRC7S_17465 [Cetobacterium sp.]
MEMVTITEQNLLVGETVVDKKSNDKVLVESISNEGKYSLSNGKTLSFSTMKKNFKLLVVEPTPVVEPVVEPVIPPVVEVINDIPPVEPVVETKVVKATNRKKKISDEQYVQIAEDFLKGIYKTKKEVATKFGVDQAIISDMFSTKYCRKSCYQAIQELKAKYSEEV